MIEMKNFKKIGFDNESDKQKAIEDLEFFLKTPGWTFLKRFIELNIADSEKQILEGDLSTDKIYSEQDFEKKMRLFMLKVKNLPEEEMELLRGVGDTEESDDPYY
jgi:abortive infection bacteriophage resistance protein